jgi:hypothetical protein
VIGGTPQLLEDPRRGLYSDPAWQRRTAKSRFVKAGVEDVSGPAIWLEPLTKEDILQLLQRLTEIYAAHHTSQHSLLNESFRIS